ncbi:hypothetical protein BU16DRAFT_114208 [Lophium mytilinum]|uniref:Uncharacterized protein n=1 Tax=Lophium mytilinum TaxID=390894 RepID=A0A6A6QK40_9PEZI|nr:hypothetical protein BU16DRAFT_114208 [Lophium mytilinum]
MAAGMHHGRTALGPLLAGSSLARHRDRATPPGEVPRNVIIAAVHAVLCLARRKLDRRDGRGKVLAEGKEFTAWPRLPLNHARQWTP